MFKSIAALFSSSMIGRILGFFRFQVLLLFFSQSGFTDNIIYTTTLVWTLNNFFVTPVVNRSLIAQLSIVSDADYSRVISTMFRRVIRTSMYTSLITILGLLLLQYFNDGFKYSISELLLIFCVLSVLGLNEVFSLYNQFKGRYFIYALNPAIWNSVLIIGVIIMSFISLESLSFYLTFLFLAILASIIIQFSYSKLNLMELKKEFHLLKGKTKVLDVKELYYNIIVIFFMGTTFFDLNIVKSFSVVGTITVLSVLMKLPELTVSVINGSVQPVIFNNVIKRTLSLSKGLFYFGGLIVWPFLILFIVTKYYGTELYSKMFNIDISDYLFSAFMVLLMMFLSTVVYMLIRLSVEFEYQKVLLFSILVAFLIKVLILNICVFSLNVLIWSNVVFYLLLIVSVLFVFVFRYINLKIAI